MTAPVRALRPVPEPSRLRAPARTMAPPWRTTTPLRLALVANGKPNSVELLDAMAEAIAARGHEVEVRRYRKGSVSIAPDARDVDDIAGWATAVLAALGD